MKTRRSSQRRGMHGFTIVELLIVVVVIAILAAITIVAYNGITASADDARLSSLASQLEKKARTNKVGSGTQSILQRSSSGNVPTNRQEFFQLNGIEQASGDVCLRMLNVHTDGPDCYPELIVGQVPKYDKKKLYMEGFYEVSTTFVNYSYWSNKDGGWIQKSIAAYTSGQEEVRSRTPADTHDLVCDPFGNGLGQYPHDDCRYDPIPQ